MAEPVLGVDGCTRGWVGIVLDRGPVAAVFGPTFAEVVERAEESGSVSVVAVDMPVGLLATRPRRCDAEAQARLGARRATLFTMPVREALGAPTYELCNARNRALTGVGVTRQAWGLGAKMGQVDAWQRVTGRTAWEVHPELSFAALGDGRPVAAGKKSWSGMARRLALLGRAGIRFDGDLAEAGTKAGADDVIDAAAVAWSAARLRDGVARSLPCPPETGDDGRPIAIWT